MSFSATEILVKELMWDWRKKVESRRRSWTSENGEMVGPS